MRSRRRPPPPLLRAAQALLLAAPLLMLHAASPPALARRGRLAACSSHARLRRLRGGDLLGGDDDSDLPEGVQREPLTVAYDPVTKVPPAFNEHLPKDSIEYKTWLGNKEAEEGDGERDTAKEKPMKPPASQTLEVVIQVMTVKRGKHATLIHGLEAFGICLADAKKLLAKKFACACTLKKHDTDKNKKHLYLQGNYHDDLPEYLINAFKAHGVNKANVKELKDGVKKRVLY
mmetsp:Transcript_32213/g.62938  ORF Transcript_32213/g.62938 Transcript_32213/m.62938 type:complete len:232 (+) Transcript_32213:53-748(+)